MHSEAEALANHKRGGCAASRGSGRGEGGGREGGRTAKFSLTYCSLSMMTVELEGPTSQK